MSEVKIALKGIRSGSLIEELTTRKLSTINLDNLRAILSAYHKLDGDIEDYHNNELIDELSCRELSKISKKKVLKMLNGFNELFEFEEFDPECFDRIDINIKMAIIWRNLENRSVEQIQKFFETEAYFGECENCYHSPNP